MLLKIFKNRTVSSSGTWGTKNENNYEILNFEFPEELEEYNKRIVYYLGNQKVWDPIIDNKAILTNAITTKGSVKAYVWCTKSDEAFETDVDFRTQIFVMNFFDNDNADGIVPTPEQVDGFNTMLTAMNEKIAEVNALEQTIGAAERTRQANETTRQNNEATRQENEQTRQEQEAERERRTDEAIGEIEDLTEEYNQNAQQKTEAFNNNATQKTDAFNQNAESKTNTFNTNATNKTNDFNSNASSKTTTFNENATNKTNTFNSNANDKTSAFNDNATQKTTNFDNNASSKTTTFNENATNKTNDFNNNATAKTTAFNENAQAKIDDFDEHTEEMQQEIDELSANMPWTETEQATFIDITDAAKYSKNKMKVFGNTEQASYTGKNLFSGWEEGSIDSTTGEEITYTNRYRSNFIGIIANTDYYFSNVNPTSESHTYWFTIYKYDENKNYLGFQRLNSSSPSSYNGIINISDTDVKYIRITETQPSEYFTDTQLEQGSTATDYEPYVGGVPAPSPDYPQQIHVVTGNNRIIRDSKNFYDATKAMATNSGITWGADNQYLYFNGTATSAGNRNFPSIQLKKGTYRIMLKVVEGSITTSESALFYVYGSIQTSVIRLGGTSSTQASRTFTLDEDGYIYIHGWTRTTETFNNTKIAYQVVKGDVADYNFEPYLRYIYPLELCTSKNRFDIAKSRLGKTLNTSGAINDSVYSDMSDFISVKANKTYILSFKYDTLLSQNNRPVCYYDNSLKFLSGANYTISTKQATITPTQDGYIRFSYDKNCYDIQVEEGSTATEYVPYTSLELCKIGNYQDYIYKDGDNWYKKNILNKYIFSGNENISKATDVFYTNDIANNILTSGIICLCNRLKAVANTSVGSSVPVNSCCFRPGDYSRFYFNLSSITTDIDEIKRYLSNNTTFVIYPLATPITIQITDETLIAQLEAIYNHLALVKGINHITITPSDLAPYVTLNYMQDLPAKLDNLASRIELLEE